MNYHKPNLLVDYIYGDISQKDMIYFERHLCECDRCRIELSEFNQLKSFFDQRARPEPSKELIGDYNASIRSMYRGKEIVKLKPMKNWVAVLLDIFYSWEKVRYLKYAGAAALLIVCLIVGSLNLSYHRLELQNGYLGSLKWQYYQDNLEVDEYFYKLEIVLLSIENFDLNEDAENFDIDLYKGMADELQNRTKCMMDYYESQDNDKAVVMLGQLELILLEVANMNKDGIIENLELLQEVVISSDIIFKVRRYEDLGFLL